MHSLRSFEKAPIPNKYFFLWYVKEELMVFTVYKNSTHVFLTQIVSKLTNEVLNEYVAMNKERAEKWQLHAISIVKKMKRLEKAPIQ